MSYTFDCLIHPAMEDATFYSMMPIKCALPYNLTPVISTQQIVHDRLEAIPDIRLADYRFEVVFDWIKIAVHLPVARRALDVGKVINNGLSDNGLGTAYVVGQTSGGSKWRRTFTVKVFDPTLQSVEFILRLLKDRYGLACVPGVAGGQHHRLVGAEIALDVYPRRSKASSDAEFILKRVQMTELLKKHFMPVRLFSTGEFSELLDGLRFVSGGKVIGRASRAGHKTSLSVHNATDLSAHPQGAVDASMYIGGKDREMQCKVYDKIFDGMKDRTKKAEYQISLVRTRSRLEVTLDGFSEEQTVLEALGVSSIYDIGAFSWEGLRPTLFTFMKPTFSTDAQGHANAKELEIFNRSGAFGLDLYQRAERMEACARKERDGSGSLLKVLDVKARLRRYSDLNERIKRQMRKLGKRFDPF